MRLQGTLRGRVQWWWHIQVPHRQRKNHVLPERHRHFGCRRHPDWGLAWKSLPRGLLLARWRSAVRVRVSLCEGGFILYLFSINSNSNKLEYSFPHSGLSLLRFKDNVRGIRGDAGEEQSSRAGLEHALHSVIICQSKNSQTKSRAMISQQTDRHSR